MGDEGEAKWTVWLHRERGVGPRSVRFDPRAAAAAATAVAMVLVAAGAVLGVLFERGEETERVRQLEARVEELRSRQRRVAALAGRLDSLERAYGRVRRLLGADEAGATPGLPPSAADGDVPPAATAGEAGLPQRWPLGRSGFVTRRFRASSGPAGHPGIDVAVPVGSYVRAVASGTVRESGRDSVYGRYLRLAHRDGSLSLYGHASHVFVQAGDSVERGQVIALSGNSGRSTAPHLHLEVRRAGRSVDPLRYVRSGPGDAGAADSSGSGTGESPGDARAPRDAKEERIDVR